MHDPDLQLVTELAIEPVTLDEAKDYLRVTSSAADSEITNMITAARQMAEEFTRRAFIEQEWNARFDTVPEGRVELPRPNLISITEAVYWDEDDNEVALDAADYIVSDGGQEPGWFQIREPNDIEARDKAPKFRVRYKSGYGQTASDVPWLIRQAIQVIIFQLYNNRHDTTMPVTAVNLLRPYRRYIV